MQSGNFDCCRELSGDHCTSSQVVCIKGCIAKDFTLKSEGEQNEVQHFIACVKLRRRELSAKEAVGSPVYIHVKCDAPGNRIILFCFKKHNSGMSNTHFLQMHVKYFKH